MIDKEILEVGIVSKSDDNYIVRFITFQTYSSWFLLFFAIVILVLIIIFLLFIGMIIVVVWILFGYIIYRKDRTEKSILQLIFYMILGPLIYIVKLL